MEYESSQNGAANSNSHNPSQRIRKVNLRGRDKEHEREDEQSKGDFVPSLIVTNKAGVNALSKLILPQPPRPKPMHLLTFLDSNRC